MNVANSWAINLSNWNRIYLERRLTESGVAGSDDGQLALMQSLIGVYNASVMPRWTNACPYVLQDGSPAGIIDAGNSRPAYTWYQNFIASHPIEGGQEIVSCPRLSFLRGTQMRRIIGIGFALLIPTTQAANA
jgi:hypothetical protein